MSPTTGQQNFCRDLRAYAKIKNQVIRTVRDLEAAVKSDKSEIEIQHLVNTLDVEAEKLKEKGDKITNYQQDDWAEDFKSRRMG